MRSFYEGRQDRPAWLDDTEDGAAHALLSALKAVSAESVEAIHVDVAGLESRLAACGAAAGLPECRAELEVDLSLALAIAAEQAVRGTVAPEAAGIGWRLPPRSVDLAAVLAAASEAASETASEMGRATEGVAGTLRRLETQEPLRAALGRRRERCLAAVRRGGWPAVPLRWALASAVGGPRPAVPAGDRPALAEGDGADPGFLKALAERLAAEGYLEAASLPELEGAAGGGLPLVYGAELAAVVRRFQLDYGLEPDGKIGRGTVRELNLPAAARLAQVDANRVRMRWLPEDPPELYVRVNIPAFELEVRQGAETLLRTPVIVGKSDWQTPVFADAITSLILNPPWNVPDSIAVDEILPKLRVDPHYLADEDMMLLAGRGAAAEEVDPATVDWSQVSPERFPFRVRQRPGTQNLLGKIKLSLPNPDHIYLHDTPGKSLFSRIDRALSHGCVRVKDPFAVAEKLLADLPEWQGGRLRKEAEKGTSTAVVLPRPVPVYLVYDTALLTETGDLRLLRDLYGYDPMVTRALLAGKAGTLALNAEPPPPGPAPR